MKKAWLLMALAAVAAAGLVAHKKLAKKKLNILIVSSCSLRRDLLGPYDPASAPTTKTISRFGKNAFVFWNAFSEVSWSNVSGFLSKLGKEKFEASGYHAIGRPWSDEEADMQKIKVGTPPFYFRVPEGHSAPPAPGSVQQDLDIVEERVLNRANWPFVLEVHLKFMHLPYLSPEMQILDSEGPLFEEATYAKRRIRNFLRKPRKFPEAVFLTILLGHGNRLSPEILRSLPVKFEQQVIDELFKKKFRFYLSVLHNRELLALWRKSPAFQRDLAVIKHYYRKRLEYFDALLGTTLNGFGDEDFLENTIVIFTGDHGEAFMEHGLLAHGEANFDEMLRFPLLVKFPGMKQAQTITKQVHQSLLADIVEGAMDGSLNASNLEAFVEHRTSDDYILSRNCPGDLIAIRYRNEWKLHMDLAAGTKQLFHVAVDPGETTNVIDENPDEAARLEEFWLKAASKQRSNGMVHSCNKMPWD